MFRTIKIFIQKLEDSQLFLNQFLVTFFGIIFLRNFLETFSDQDNAWTAVSSTAYLIHYPMFYLSLFLVLSIILAIVTKVKITKISKLLLYFFPVILIAPIVDLLLSNGNGYNMSYFFCDFEQLVKKYFTFSGTYQDSGATPGIQIELIVIFSLTTAYLFLKSKKASSAILGLLLFYSAAFFMGALPSLVTIAWNFIQPSLSTASELYSGEVILFHFYSFNDKMVLTFFPILVLELSAWFWIYDQKKFKVLIKNLRGFRVFHYLCMLGFGIFIGISQISDVQLLESPFSFLIFISMAGSVLFAWWAAVGINDIFDFEGDKISNPKRPLTIGLFEKKELRAINLIFACFSLIIAFIVRYPFFLTILLALVLSTIYSSPPFRLKRIPILSTFVIALCAALISLGGFVVFSKDYSFSGYPPKILLAILVAYTLGLPFKDIKDLAGDKITGVKTFLTLWGEKKGKQITSIFVVLAYITAILVLGIFYLFPLAFIFGGLSFYYINRKKYREAPLFFLYFLFLSVTFYFIHPTIGL